MKPKMYSSQSNSLLHDHIIDGFHATHELIKNAKEQNLIKEEEYTSLLERNIQRLVQRIHEFRIKEGLVEMTKRMACIYFAVFFAWAQINGDDLEMRRASRTRTSRTNSRSVRSQRNGRRRLEEI